MATQTINAIVRGLRREADHVLSVELCPASQGEHLPSFEPGAHINLWLEESLVRSYSLCNDPDEPDRYVVAVLRDRDSRGGSVLVHENLRVGQMLTISAPRNNFPLIASEAAPVFVAGGIGITPILSMLRHLSRQGREATLYYCARSRREAAFLDVIEQFKPDQFNVSLHFDEETGGGPPELTEMLREHSASSHFYCCGPQTMLAAFEATCAELGFANARIERFSALPPPQTKADDTFQVELRKSGQIVCVGAEYSILEALLYAGLLPNHSCKEGLCGECETRIIEGEADHRDSILTANEQATNKSMMICVSRSKSAKLVLDL